MQKLQNKVVLFFSFVLLMSHPLSLAYADDFIRVSGILKPLIIYSAIAGQAPSTVSDSSTTYTVHAKGNRKITGQLNLNTPSYTILKVNLAAPPKAKSLGAITLSTLAKDLVTDIPKGNYQDLPITYYFSATTAAGVVSLTTRTMTLTLLDL